MSKWDGPFLLQSTAACCEEPNKNSQLSNLIFWSHTREAAHGKDDRPVEPMKMRRSVGAEVNWGIRFTCEADADTFLDSLAGISFASVIFTHKSVTVIDLKVTPRMIASWKSEMERLVTIA